jgi:hypothetical protein
MFPDLAFALRLFRDPAQRRHVLRWLRSRRPDYLLKKRVPWLTFDALNRLAALEIDGRRVFEYGSGGSTLYWQARGAITVSVEHDPAWFAVVRSRLAATPAVDYRLIEPQPERSVQTSDPSDPDAYLSTDVRWREASFRPYVTAIEEFRDGTFDIVLVDGRARPSCIKHGAPKVAPGGALILDDSQRPYYLAGTRGYLKGFVEERFLGPSPTVPTISATSIFRRLGFPREAP